MRSEPVVLLTRGAGENTGLASRLRELGIAAIELPCVRVEALGDPAPLHEAVAALTADDLLVITSANGARALEGQECRAPVAAVGPATAAACVDAGLRVTFVPSVATGRALAEEVPLPRGMVLLARSDRALPEPAEILRRRGAAVVGEVVAYRTVPVPVDRVPAADAVVFASPSAVDGFAALGTRPALAIATGSVTADRVRAVLGIDPLLATADDAALARAIQSALEGHHAIAGR